MKRMLVVDRRDFTVKLWERPENPANGWELVEMWECAVGDLGFKTPTGVFEISAKTDTPNWHVPDSQWAKDAGLKPGAVVPYDDPANPIKGAWLTVDALDGIGFHGTGDRDSIGTRASHGCIRMKPRDVLELFDMVPVGTPVVIE